MASVLSSVEHVLSDAEGEQYAAQATARVATVFIAADYRRILLPTLLFVANVTVGLSALSRVNIPMFSAFRRLTILFATGAQYMMLHKTHPKPVIVSVCVLTFVAFVSALGDVTFTHIGYALVFADKALTAAYLASIKRVLRDLSLGPISLLYYTNIMGFPVIH